MTFLEYLKKQRHKNNAIGDFARDWISDRERPSRVRELDRITAYLECRNACEGAFDAARAAWTEWEKIK